MTDATPAADALARDVPPAAAASGLSIITPVYNAEAHLPRLLASLERIAPSRRARVQWIAVDDGSQDGSAELIERWRREPHGLGAVELVRQANAGSAAARNAGLRLAQRRWVLMLDADDELACDLVEVLDTAGDATAVLCAVELVKHGRLWRRRPAPRIDARRPLRTLTAGNPFAPPSLVCRRELLGEGFDTRLRYREDWHFWMTHPGVFERPVRKPGVVSARVHAHGGNKSGRYAEAGRYRAQAAADVLAREAGRLTRRERNNLRMQMAIGRKQQGEPMGPAALLRLPCSLALWGKAVLYLALGRLLYRFDFYG